VSGLEVPTACTTPCAIVAKRNADISITFQKEGYEPQIVQLTREIPGAGAAGFAGNLLAGGLIGMGVDAATGAATDHKPNTVIITLQPSALRRPPAWFVRANFGRGAERQGLNSLAAGDRPLGNKATPEGAPEKQNRRSSDAPVLLDEYRGLLRP
jgi:hypothetical protein